MKDKLAIILDRLSNSQADLKGKQMVAGFDGFIDSIQKVVYSHTEDRGTEYFKRMEDFGRYVAAKKSGGLSLETEETVKKFGGNVPIMANATARLGLSVHCIGAFGYPETDPVFSQMQDNISLHSFANPGITSALEFNDGKIMLAQMTGLNQADWKLVKERTGFVKIVKIVEESHLLCLLNWSEVRHVNGMWEGLLREVLPVLSRKTRLKAFFDLADCSKYSGEQIRQALELIKQFTGYCDVSLSLNGNEASLVSRALELSPSHDPKITGEGIASLMNINTLIIHTSGSSFAWRDSVMHQADTFFLENPLISTGAGDNFNAGFCIGQLIDLEAEQSLILANLFAVCYMKNGQSPGLKELRNFVNEQIN